MDALADQTPFAVRRDAATENATDIFRRSSTNEDAGSAPNIPAARPLRAKLHTDLATLATTWRSFQERGACTAYQRLDWIEPLLGHLAGATTPLFVEVSDAGCGDPIVILPMVLREKRGHRVIEWLDLGVCDYAAPLVAPGVTLSPAEAEHAWTVARSVLPPADLIRITRMPDTVFGTQNPLAMVPGVREIPLRSSGLALEGAPESLLKRVCSRSTFKDASKRRRRLGEQGEVRFVHAETEAEIETIFEVLLQQRRSRFRDMGRFDLLDQPDVVAFYREAARRGLSDGLVHVFGISVDGEWIATAYGLVHHGAFHGVLLAMGGEAWKPFAPGIVIVSELMVWARARGLDYFDFTIGSLSYKNGFRPSERALFELALPLTLRGRIVLAAERVAVESKAALQRHPAAFDVLRAGRQRLRRVANSARARLGRA